MPCTTSTGFSHVFLGIGKNRLEIKYSKKRNCVVCGCICLVLLRLHSFLSVYPAYVLGFVPFITKIFPHSSQSSSSFQSILAIWIGFYILLFTAKIFPLFTIMIYFLKTTQKVTRTRSRNIMIKKKYFNWSSGFTFVPNKKLIVCWSDRVKLNFTK